jgi:hypothetical protein
MHYFGSRQRRSHNRQRAAEAAEAAEAVEAAASAALPESVPVPDPDPDPDPDAGTSDVFEWPMFPATLVNLALKLHSEGASIDSILLAIEANGPLKRVPSEAAVKCWIRRWKREKPPKPVSRQKKTEKRGTKTEPDAASTS